MFSEYELQSFLQQNNDLITNLNLGVLEASQKTLQSDLESPQVWSDQALAKDLNQKLGSLSRQIERIHNLQNLLLDLQAAFELGDEAEFVKIIEQVKIQTKDLENSAYLNGKFDSRDSLVSIHAGAGGIDAQDWAAMLASMYQAFVQNQGWTYKIIALSSGEEGGIKSMTLEVEGLNSYGYLKEEAGVHRLVRISPFNAGKTRETSFALVEVLPADLDKNLEMPEIPEKELRWEFFLSSGKGGQSVNTTYSAVRLIHIPTNIVVTCQNERSQAQNKAQAMKYLRNKLAALEIKKNQDLKNEIKGDVVSMAWGSQIRSYVLHPYKLIKDHRSNYETSDVPKVLEYGHLEDFIWSLKKIQHTNETVPELTIQ